VDPGHEGGDQHEREAGRPRYGARGRRVAVSGTRYYVPLSRAVSPPSTSSRANGSFSGAFGAGEEGGKIQVGNTTRKSCRIASGSATREQPGPSCPRRTGE
jgi:hypothetical protein